MVAAATLSRNPAGVSQSFGNVVRRLTRRESGGKVVHNNIGTSSTKTP